MAVIVRLANTTVPTGNQFVSTNVENNFADIYTLPQNPGTTGVDGGKFFTIKAYGYISSKAVSPGTLTLRIKQGSTTLGTAVINLATSMNNAGFMLDAIVMICTPGGSGKYSCQGFVIIDNAGVAITAAIVNTGTLATGQITINTGLPNALAISQQFSVSDANNIVTLTQLIIEEKV